MSRRLGVGYGLGKETFYCLYKLIHKNTRYVSLKLEPQIPVFGSVLAICHIQTEFEPDK